MAELLSRLQGALSDRYRIDREIGAGGMATVYLAHDLRHDRRVALKLMRPELSAVIGAERFTQALLATVQDRDLAARPLTGAVSQWVDSTDVLRRPGSAALS